MKKFCFQSLGETSPENPFPGREGFTPCVCLYMTFYVTFPPDLDLYKQRHYGSHHIHVKGIGQPCSSGLWQTPGTWGDPGAGQYLPYRPPSALWAPREITALITGCRNGDHGGRGAKELQEKAACGISPSHSGALPASFPRDGERSPLGSGKCNGRWMACISPSDILPLAALGAICI